jgi:hypothetical protein
VWALLQGVPAAGQMTPAEALREAMDTETVKGDLRSALEQYLALSGSADRGIAARALVRMAGVHEKLVQPGPARIARERVVSEFGDQAAAVADARQRIEAPAPMSLEPRTERVRPHPGGGGRVTGDPPLVAYIGPSGNQAVMDLSTGHERVLTEGGALDGVMSVESIASPDGRRVAYSWYDQPAVRGSLRIVDTTAASGAVPAPFVIYDNPDVWLPVATDWSADSRYLAVRLERVDDTSQIALVGVTDRSVRLLHTLGWNGKVEIRLSPDARYVAFDMPGAEETADQHIFVMAVDGSSRVAVTPNPGAYRVVGWTADGQRVLFTRQQEGRTSLWAATVRRGRPDGAARMLAPSLDGQPLGLTPSGALYYRVLVNGADRAGASFDATTGRLTSAPSRPLQPAAAIHQGGGWSPDGRWLAYTGSDRPGGDWALFVRDMTTAVARQVPQALAYLAANSSR